ncbi:MAG: TonB C-terminal domain-containing protein [Salaquimonas sp.]|nr:TonB C-terminal domain-containing protein [Salaquimonas sp.]
MAHIAVLAWGLVSLSGPKPLAVADVEALPIDIVPVEDLSRSVQGEKKADLTEKPAPTPTTRPQTVPDARNVGDAKNDKFSERKPKSDNRTPNNQRSEAAPPSPEPTPAPEVAPDPIKELVNKNEPTPTTELSSLNEPPVPVTEEPKPAPKPEEAVSQEKFAELPKTAPVPDARPKARTAETRERKQPDDKPKARQTASSNESKSTEDRIANLLLNKEEAAASGAKRSADQASLGTRQSSNAARLSQSEMDALRGQIQACWNPPAAIGAEELKVSVRFKLDRDGLVDGPVTIMDSSGNQAADDSARRAVLRCGQQGYKLPADKYEAWRDVVVNFDPSELF